MKNGSCRRASSSPARRDRPPDPVVSVDARGERRAMAQRARVALEGGECDAALVRLVAVMDEVAGHASRLAPIPHPDIGRAPRSRTLIPRRGYARQRSALPVTEVADHLVGRAAELEAIDRAIGELCEGRSAPLVVQGEPGIGKTRLLAELAERADARGCIVLGGSASELERDLPFWVFVDALDEYVAGLDPQLVAVAPRGGAQRARARDAVPVGVRIRRRSDRAGRALPRPPRGARAARAAGGRPAAGAACSTTSTGRTPPRWSCWPRSCAARPTPPSWS